MLFFFYTNANAGMKGVKVMWNEFKEFIMRGNVIDLAVGVVMGSAFTTIVNALVENIITPLLTAVTGHAHVSDLTVKVGTAQIQYGVFIQAVIDFLLISAVLFVVIKGINRLMRKKKEEPEEVKEEIPAEEQYLKEIRDLIAAQTDSKMTE